MGAPGITNDLLDLASFVHQVSHSTDLSFEDLDYVEGELLEIACETDAIGSKPQPFTPGGTYKAHTVSNTVAMFHGERLRAIRHRYFNRTKDAAHAAHVEPATWSSWETTVGPRNIGVVNMRRMAQLFGMSLDDLYDELYEEVLVW